MALGRLQLYTGNGKGKSTAAIGLTVRAAGHGMRSFIGQFLKGSETGEVRTLSRIPEVTLEQFGGPDFVLPGKISDRDTELAQAGITRIRQILKGGSYALLVLDEVIGALDLGLLSPGDLMSILDEARRLEVEVVCTGRNAPDWLIERADLVSEVEAVKHYFRGGLPARVGIEY